MMYKERCGRDRCIKKDADAIRQKSGKLEYAVCVIRQKSGKLERSVCVGSPPKWSLTCRRKNNPTIARWLAGAILNWLNGI